jgi:hypothetical protein
VQSSYLTVITVPVVTATAPVRNVWRTSPLREYVPGLSLIENAPVQRRGPAHALKVHRLTATACAEPLGVTEKVARAPQTGSAAFPTGTATSVHETAWFR